MQTGFNSMNKNPKIGVISMSTFVIIMLIVVVILTLDNNVVLAKFHHKVGHHKGSHLDYQGGVHSGLKGGVHSGHGGSCWRYWYGQWIWSC